MTPDELQALRAAYDRELRIEIEYPDQRKETLPQVVRFVRTVEPGRGFINYAWLEGVDIAAALREQVDYFRELGIPFEWLVCDHDLCPGLKEQLLAHGFAPDLEPGDPGAVLVLDLRSLPPTLSAPNPSGHAKGAAQDVRPITQPGRLADVIRVMEQVWGGSFAWIQPRLGRHMAVPDYLSVYASYENEEPVCTGWTYFPPGSQFASLYGGSTIPAYRRRGHYTALLAARAQEAARRGRRYLVVYAGLESRPVAEKNGFQVLTYACSYEWKSAPPHTSNP